MTHDGHGLHHFHKRKRKGEVPHSEDFKKFLDKFIYFIGIIGPIMTIPQILKIWVLKTAAGVSFLSWATYLFCGIVWLVYGIVHKDKPIIFMYCLWIVIDIIILAGIIVHGSGFL